MPDVMSEVRVSMQAWHGCEMRPTLQISFACLEAVLSRETAIIAGEDVGPLLWCFAEHAKERSRAELVQELFDRADEISPESDD